MSAGAGEPGVPFEPAPFEPRPIRAEPVIELRGHRLKPYTVTLPGETLDEGVYAEGTRLAADALPEPVAARTRPGLGFLIRHQGLDVGGDRVHYLVLCWWDNTNELFTRTFIRGASTGHAWTDAAGRGAPCVWDLQIIWHERNAFIRHMLTGAPDTASYLADTLQTGD